MAAGNRPAHWAAFRKSKVAKVRLGSISKVSAVTTPSTTKGARAIRASCSAFAMGKDRAATSRLYFGRGLSACCRRFCCAGWLFFARCSPARFILARSNREHRCQLPLSQLLSFRALLERKDLSRRCEMPPQSPP
ncbi:hypothetical protein EXN51_26295 [Agrobacterium fabrum]|uniref:Uncharacterized protein n=1 Tax=Agrobacterium fabrum (strain C58 / ATCC 33970) TaxID=176299 RepID=Q7D368_AGRFC|nr:hypothetical protein Atu5397 [Agrobacterium fabrum str. C58]TRB22802.1 hypothetical protein EXN51_26295 [Agrobacterium fabrum]